MLLRPEPREEVRADFAPEGRHGGGGAQAIPVAGGPIPHKRLRWGPPPCLQRLPTPT